MLERLLFHCLALLYFFLANMNLKDDPPVDGQMLTYIVIAAGSMVLLTISIAVFLATLIYCRSKYHHTVPGVFDFRKKI